ncbi:MAG: GNAT family N-acetyltransferase [Clostridia bacterium]|nr:GNAT family N-acetyltransferase [Clostridia bacterium]
MQAVLYIHGKGGSASESAHYQRFFPGQTVVGLAYQAETPREAGQEICAAAAALKKDHESVTLIANSIGAYFSMFGGADAWIDRAFFISPIVDMEQLICGLMAAEHVTEEALQARGVVPTAFGEPLSWEYLCRVRAHPICWNAPTAILYGGRDTLTDYETVASFAEKHGAALTVMEEGEHWFHTPAQMRFLDRWLRDCLFAVRPLEAAETDAALALAWRVFTEFESPDYAPEGTEEFRKALHDAGYLSGLRFFGAFDDDRLIGEIGVRPDRMHICFFFVDGQYHRLGVGTKLFRYLLQTYPGKTITLNSSPYGLPFYKALGFAATDSEQTVNGIRFTPMAYAPDA